MFKDCPPVSLTHTLIRFVPQSPPVAFSLHRFFSLYLVRNLMTQFIRKVIKARVEIRAGLNFFLLRYLNEIR